MKTASMVIIVIAVFLCSYFAEVDAYQSPVVVFNQSAVPDISTWTKVNTSRIELKISKDFVAYMGLEVEYSNPSNPKEFIRVISRHIPMVASIHKNPDQRLSNEASVLSYLDKGEQERLTELSKKADPFLYINWHKTENPKTKVDMLDGDVNIWLMSPAGSWVFNQNGKVEVELLTENVGNEKPHIVFSGIKYQVGTVNHILRIDRSDVLRSLGKGK